MVNGLDLEGRVALVTGAGSGIGLSHALHLPSLGAAVIVHDINAKAVNSAVQAVRDAGGNAIGLVCDVRDVSSFRAGIERTAAEMGGVDILVNNVGIPADGTIEDCTAQAFETAFQINVYSFVVAAQTVLPAMKARRGGKIINTSSNWALTGQENSSLYSATKAAILGLTKSWARELAPWNITVNCVAPGGINTELLQTNAARLSRIPLARHGDPIDVSHTVAFLASGKSNYMTGCVFNLTGGELIPGC
jgi:3-oxoacyl-[acyl-carrier protein] reductase